MSKELKHALDVILAPGFGDSSPQASNASGQPCPYDPAAPFTLPRQDMTTDKRELLPARCEECGAIHKPSPARPSSPAPVQPITRILETVADFAEVQANTYHDQDDDAAKAFRLIKDRLRGAALSAKPPVQSVEVGLAAFLDGLEVHLRGLGEADSDHKRGYKAATEAIIADGRKFLASPSAPEEWDRVATLRKCVAALLTAPEFTLEQGQIASRIVREAFALPAPPAAKGSGHA